jgi:formamidopyrimidine-DNA glycosylase
VPELPEVETYRALARAALDREIVAVNAPDAWYLKGGTTDDMLRDALIGARFVADRRVGKLLLLDVSGGGTLGLRFGMSGRLLVDGVAGIDALEYSSSRDEPAWDRFAVRFGDGGDLRIRDPRRLGGVQLDPDESRLGIDAIAIRPAQLRAALAGSTAPLKARLMDQARIAGIGNLLADEMLWRAGLDPARPAGSLTEPELRRLLTHLRSTVADLIARGGSHTGDLHGSRFAGGHCPRDGAPLVRRTIGGRTTYSCPRHQR